MKKLIDVLQKYKDHPEFLGIDLIDANQPGAVDDTSLHIASRMGELEDVEVFLANGANEYCWRSWQYTLASSSHE